MTLFNSLNLISSRSKAPKTYIAQSWTIFVLKMLTFGVHLGPSFASSWAFSVASLRLTELVTVAPWQLFSTAATIEIIKLSQPSIRRQQLYILQRATGSFSMDYNVYGVNMSECEVIHAKEPVFIEL